MTYEKYLIDGETGKSRSNSEVYVDACRELLLPMPSVPFQRFKKLNQLTGGLRPNEFTILCGATGIGKTTLCANLSLDLMMQGVPHYVASVETGSCDYVKRMISAMVESDWNTGDKVEVQELKNFHAKHGGYFQAENFWLSIYEDRFKVRELLSNISWHVKNKGVKVAIVDNLNFFLDVTSVDNTISEMDRVIHDIIIYCKQAPIHLVMVMHPKKTDHGRVESEFDIKGSSTAVQEAHNVLLFNRVHPDLIKAGCAAEGDREILIAKMRRKGKFVRHRLVLPSVHGVSYFEGAIV